MATLEEIKMKTSVDYMLTKKCKSTVRVNNCIQHLIQLLYSLTAVYVCVSLCVLACFALDPARCI